MSTRKADEKVIVAHRTPHDRYKLHRASIEARPRGIYMLETSEAREVNRY